MQSLRILLLANPHSRKGDESDEHIRKKLHELGIQIVNSESYETRDFEKAIAQYATQVDAVVVGGGDGSMNAVVPSLIQHKLPLGVIPMGTSNNLSRNLDIPIEIDEACKVIANGQKKRIDLGRVNDFYFLNVAGMGVSNEVNRTVPAKLKKYLGMFAYAITAFKIFKNYKRFRADIVLPDRTVCVRAIQISVCNGQFFASGVKIAPDASIDDGMLDLCSIHVKSWFEIPKVMADFKKGTVDEDHSAFLTQAKTFTVTTSRTVLIDTDGEIRTQTPAKFEVVPKAIEVYCT